MENKLRCKISRNHLIYIVIVCISFLLLIIVGIAQNNKTQKHLKVYNNLTLSTFGDSITSQGLWQPHVVAELGFSKHNNYGISGTKVSGTTKNAMWQDFRIDQISKKSDVILFMGGTNDWSHNVPLGNINSNDTQTFYGALNVISSKLISRFPNSKIIFLSTTFAMAPKRSTFKNKTGILNDLGLMNIDYGKATQKVAKEKNISFIDLTNCDFSKDNIANYTTFDGNYIHPNTDGAKKMAQVIVARLREIKTTK